MHAKIELQRPTALTFALTHRTETLDNTVLVKARYFVDVIVCGSTPRESASAS